MDGNRETVLDELNDFEKRSGDISPVLEDFLTRVAKSGDTMFPWIKLKPLLRKKLELVLDDFYETCPTDSLPPLPNVESFKYDILKNKILEALDSFHSAPFTIQRICELLTTPRKHYKRTDKFMRGLEKNILVVSTIEPKNRIDYENNNNTIGIMNGLIPTSDLDQNCKENSPTTIIPLPAKPNNCDSQFDNMSVLSSSSIVTEISSVLQKENFENSSSVNSMSPDKSSISENANNNEMDISSYHEDSDHLLCKSDSDSSCTDNQTSNDSSPELPITLSSEGGNQTLENFAIFSPPVLSTSSEVNGVSSAKKSENIEPDKIINCSTEKENLPNFQEHCDVHSIENAMDVTSSVVPDDEPFVESPTHISSPSTTGSSDNQDFFEDLCCSSSQEQNNQSVFSHDSSDSFPLSKAETKAVSPVPNNIIEETVIDTVESAIFSNAKQEDDDEKSCVDNNVNNDDKISNAQPFLDTITDKMNIECDSGDIHHKETDSNCNLIETNTLSPHDSVDVESQSTPEQTVFSESTEEHNHTNESDSMEIEHD